MDIVLINRLLNPRDLVMRISPEVVIIVGTILLAFGTSNYPDLSITHYIIWVDT